MKPYKFENLCKKHGVEVGDLPAFPPKDMTDKQWEFLIKAIGKAKKKYENTSKRRVGKD
jgi:hypothetical protein